MSGAHQRLAYRIDPVADDGSGLVVVVLAYFHDDLPRYLRKGTCKSTAAEETQRRIGWPLSTPSVSSAPVHL